MEFFRKQILIARVLGIPVRVDTRWFVVLLLTTLLTGTAIPANIVPDLAARLILGFITSLVFFFSIFLHELGHSLAARQQGIEVRDIILHPFGGLARFRHAPETPRAEFIVAAAGPVTSLLISFFFLALWAATSAAALNALSPLLFALFLGNLLLAIFNLFPGYPLDGGRILRAYLWKRGKDLHEATLLTGRAGQVIGAGLIFVGIGVTVFRADLFTGLWTAIVGYFLFDSANGIVKQLINADSTVVSEVMSLPVAVPPDVNLLHFVDNILPNYRQPAFLVSHERQLFGILVLEDMKAVEREVWHKTLVREAMRPIEPEHFVEAESLLTDAKELLRINGVDILGVLNESGQLVGFLQRGRIRRRSSKD